MILDKLKNLINYLNIHSAFGLVDEYLIYNDLNKLEPGTYKIDGDKIYIIIAEAKANPDANPKIETHKKYIDIQITIDGSFKLGWKALSDCKDINKEYDSESDYQLFNEEPDFVMNLLPGTFAVYFPEDGHLVYPPEKYVKKAIFKVLVDY